MRTLRFFLLLAVSINFSHINGQDNFNKANLLCTALLNQDKEQAIKLSKNMSDKERYETLKEIAKILAQKAEKQGDQISRKDVELFFTEFSKRVNFKEIKRIAHEVKGIIVLSKECGLIKEKAQFNELNIILDDLDKLIISAEKMPNLDEVDELEQSEKKNIINNVIKVVRNGLSTFMKVNAFIIKHALNKEEDKPHRIAMEALNDFIYLIDGATITVNPSSWWITKSAAVLKRVPALIRLMLLMIKLDELKDKQKEANSVDEGINAS